MKEAPGSSETSVLTRATRRNNPEDTILRVALVQTNVSENVSSPSSEFLKFKGFHNYVAEETLLLSLSKQGHCYYSMNTVFRDFCFPHSIQKGYGIHKLSYPTGTMAFHPGTSCRGVKLAT
jgi:hypothetical protein